MSTLSNLIIRFNTLIDRGEQINPVEKDLNAADLLSKLQQIVFQINSSSKWVYLNTSWTQLTGYSQDETLGTRLLNYIHPKDRSIVEEYLQKLYQQSNDEGSSLLVRILTKQNNSIYTVLRANTIFSHYENGTIKGIIGTITDVAEKMHEQEILRAKYRSLCNFVDNYIGMLYRCRNDQDLTIEYASIGCQELTGYNQKQMVEKNEVTYISIVHPDDRQRIMETIQYNFPDGKEYELTHRIVTADGIERWVLNKGKGVYTSSGELLSFEGSLLDFDKQKHIQNRSQRTSLYDPNSKLLNKLLFIDRIEHAIEKIKFRNNYAFTVLLLSIDQHTQLLESLGSKNIEYLMAEIGQRIFEDLQQPISMCKLQNNHFGILVDSQQYTLNNITKIINQIQGQVQAPLSIDENEIYVTASIGVVIGNSRFEDSNSILLEAQNALSRAISLGGARYEVSDLITHGKAALQSHMEYELEQALIENKLLVHWQPIVALKNNKLIGLEARLVWPHPIKGLLYADQFVPESDDTQLITPLWEWMLNEACRQIETWNNSIPKIENLALNIQVTGASLLDADTIFRLREKLLLVKPDLCNLVVGVSEKVLSRAPQSANNILKPIEGKNIQLLLDGYGSEITSLRILENTPIDIVRLDSKLVADCLKDRGNFIRAIVSLLHSLNISVLAYGVKSESQFKILNDANVDIAQGNYISNPITEEATKDILLVTLES